MTASEDTGARPAARRGDEAKLLAWLKAQLKAKPDRKVRGLLLLEGARLLERGGRVGEAAKTLVTAANTDPRLLPAVWALIHIFVRRKSWKNIARLREAEAKAAATPAEKSAALTAHGELLEDRLGEPSEAAALFDKAREANGEDRLALLATERSAVGSGDVAKLAAAIEALAALTTDPRRRALWLVDLAELQESLTDGSAERALELLREAAAIEEGQWHWVGALEAYARREGARDAVAEALEARARIVAAYASVETASEATRFGAPRVRDPKDAAGRAASYYRQAARLREELGDRDAALEDLRATSALVPEDPLVADSLLRQLEGTGHVDDARALLEERIGEALAGAESVVLRLALAELRARTGDVDGAIEQWGAVLAVDPGSLRAVLGAAELLTASSRWPELAELYEGVAASLEEDAPSLGAAFLVRAAEIHERYLEQPERAIELLGRVRGTDVDVTLSLYAAASIHARLGQWRRLANVLDDLVDRTDDDATTAGLLSELAAVQLGQLSEPVLALTTYGRLLQRDPGALWVLEMMAELHASLEQWVELSSLLRRIADVTDSEEHAAACLAVAGWLLHTRAEETAEAEACYRASLEKRPDGTLAAAGLEELLRRGHDDGGLRGLLRERADAATSEADAERALLALALDHERMGEAGDAASVYAEILDRFGGSRGARWGLIRSLRREARWGDLGDVLDAEVDELLGARGRAGALLELAEVSADRLGKLAMAEDSLRRAREADPELVPATLMLLEMARANASWEEVDQLLQELLSLAPEAALLVAEERLALLSGAGRDDEAASIIADVLLENMPRHPGALLTKGLVGAALHESEERAYAYRRLSDREGSSPSGAALAAHSERVARLAGLEHERGPDVPVSGPIPPPALVALAERGDLPSERDMEILEARAELCGDASARLTWDFDLADVAIARGDLEAALTAYQRILAAAPANITALEGLRIVAAALELWEVRAEATERLAELYVDEAAAAALWASAARTWEVELDNAERAELAARRALTLDRGRGDAFARLLGLLERRGEREAQILLLEDRIEAVDEPSEVVALSLAAAALLVEVGRREDAVSRLEQALTVEPSNGELLRARSRLLVADERWDAAVEALMAEASYAEGGAKRLALWRASEILDAGLGQPGRALQPLRVLADAGDPEPETYRRLLASARRARSWPDAAWAVTALANSTEDLELHTVALRADGRIRGTMAGDPAGARRAWQRLTDLRPDDLEAIESLAGLSEGADRSSLLEGLEAKVRASLREDATDPARLRALARVHRLGGHRDGLLCVLQVIDALGAAEVVELDELRDLEATVVRDPQRPLSRESVARRLKHPGQLGPGEELHAVLGPILHKVYAADLSAMSLGRPLAARGGDLLFERVSAGAEAIGVEKVVIRPGGSDPFAIFAVPGPVATLGVGSQVSGNLGLTQRFLLGRALWHCLWQTAALAERTTVQIRALQDAATKEGDKSFQPTERRLGVDALQREIHRHLRGKSRRALAEAAQVAARATEDALARWALTAKLSADRAGLLLCGDPRAALPVVVAGWRGADPSERATAAERVRASGPGRELLAFAISEEYLALRRELGLTTQGW